MKHQSLSRTLLCILLMLAVLLSACAAPATQPSDSMSREPDSTAPTDPPVLLTEGERTDWVIIRPSDITDAVTNAVIVLRDRIRALGGVSLKISEDFDYDADRQADVCAILVGKTKAPESRRQMQALGYHDWAVTRQGRQIYVVSNTEQALVEALACFGSELIDAYQTESGAPAVRYLGDRHMTGTAAWLEGMNASPTDCTVCYPAGNTALRRVAEQISQVLRKNFSAKVAVCDDSTAPGAHEILLGPVNRPAYQAFAGDGLDPLRTYLQITDGHLIITGWDAAASEIAASQFLKRLRTAALFSDRFDLPANLAQESLAYRGGDGAMTADADTRILSFNLLSNEWGGEALPGRDYAALATILTYRPTVAGLQEVCADWYAAIRPILEQEGYAFVAADTAGNGSGDVAYTTLIYDTRVVRLKESAVEPYSCGDTRLRLLMWGLFEHLSDGSRFVATSTHWDLPQYGERRTVHAAEMAQKVRRLSDTYRVPVFCTGDFNTLNSDEQYTAFTNDSGFTDASADAEKKGTVCRTIHAVGSQPKTNIKEAYDHIFHSPNITPLWFTVILDSTALAASDHTPLIADFTVRKAA